MADDKRYTFAELSPEANFAFAYATAMIGGPKSMAYKGFQLVLSKLNITGADKRRALQKGLLELLERGIIEAAKNGEGDYEPTVLHGEKIEQGTPSVVLN